jgi:formylglycine-generating enzyme
MKRMKKMHLPLAAFALLCLAGTAQANITIDTVTVGDTGNAGDYRFGYGYMGYGPDSYGSVSYTYNIGKYEVTAGQYTAFLNAVAKTDTYGLYNSNMWSSTYGCKIQQTGSTGYYSYSVASDWGNRPVNYVSYWDSCRFANWLSNGQKTGAQDATTTEHGAYTLDGYTGSDGRTIQRNAGWAWAVTSEDEWYKAAYYKGGSTSAGYWLYPTQSDTAPANQVLSTDPGNSANYNYNTPPGQPYQLNLSIGSPYYRTNVGEFENSGSAYGTYDQGGNVWEWNEALPLDGDANRGQRGGSFNGNANVLRSSFAYIGVPDWGSYTLGFRVSHVPEPSSIIALLGGLTGLIRLRRRTA